MPKAIRLELARWPESDRQRWETANAAGDFFADGNLAAHWSPKTRYQAQAAYGRWLAFVDTHFPDALALPLEARVDRERLGAYVETLASRVTPMSVADELGHMILALSALTPGTDWAWIRKVQYRFEKAAVPREKRHRMVHPSRLIELGLKLMDNAFNEKRQIDRACQYRDGLLIALLAYRPLRRRSLASLQLDVHVRRTRGGYTLALPGEDTKSRQPLEFSIPARLTPAMTRYIEQVRPLFPHAEAENALWLSAKGGALTDGAIYSSVCRRTKLAFGLAVNPHLFRDIAATTIVQEAPEQLLIARDLLTHANVETTLRHYTRAQSVAAGRALAAAMEQRRRPHKA